MSIVVVHCKFPRLHSRFHTFTLNVEMKHIFKHISTDTRLTSSFIVSYCIPKYLKFMQVYDYLLLRRAISDAES